VANDGNINVILRAKPEGSLADASNNSETSSEILRSAQNDKNAKLNIQNQLGDTVASIDASGSAFFKNLALEKFTPATTEAALIAAPENFAKNGIFAPAIEASASAAGTGVIPKNSQEVVIYSSFAKPTSLIYLTPKTSQPISLSVFEKKDGFFRVIRNELLDQDITFDWLIIN